MPMMDEKCEPVKASIEGKDGSGLDVKVHSSDQRNPSRCRLFLSLGSAQAEVIRSVFPNRKKVVPVRVVVHYT